MLFGGLLFCAGDIFNGFDQAVWMLILGRILAAGFWYWIC